MGIWGVGYGCRERNGRAREGSGGTVEMREVGGREAQRRGWRKGEWGTKREEEDPCLAHLPPPDMAVLISPALIASINNTAL